MDPVNERKVFAQVRVSDVDSFVCPWHRSAANNKQVSTFIYFQSTLAVDWPTHTHCDCVTWKAYNRLLHTHTHFVYVCMHAGCRQQLSARHPPVLSPYAQAAARPAFGWGHHRAQHHERPQHRQQCNRCFKQVCSCEWYKLGGNRPCHVPFQQLWCLHTNAQRCTHKDRQAPVLHAGKWDKCCMGHGGNGVCSCKRLHF
jgi:hypothetical protein